MSRSIALFGVFLIGLVCSCSDSAFHGEGRRQGKVAINVPEESDGGKQPSGDDEGVEDAGLFVDGSDEGDGHDGSGDMGDGTDSMGFDGDEADEGGIEWDSAEFGFNSGIECADGTRDVLSPTVIGSDSVRFSKNAFSAIERGDCADPLSGSCQWGLQCKDDFQLVACTSTNSGTAVPDVVMNGSACLSDNEERKARSSLNARCCRFKGFETVPQLASTKVKLSVHHGVRGVRDPKNLASDALEGNSAVVRFSESSCSDPLSSQCRWGMVCREGYTVLGCQIADAAGGESGLDFSIMNNGCFSDNEERLAQASLQIVCASVSKKDKVDSLLQKAFVACETGRRTVGSIGSFGSDSLHGSPSVFKLDERCDDPAKCGWGIACREGYTRVGCALTIGGGGDRDIKGEGEGCYTDNDERLAFGEPQVSCCRVNRKD